jgi:hypothetical protein
MKKVLIIFSAALFVTISVVNVNLLKKNKPLHTTELIFNKALASGENNEYIMNDDNPYVLPTFEVRSGDPATYDPATPPSPVYPGPPDHVDIGSSTPGITLLAPVPPIDLNILPLP